MNVVATVCDLSAVNLKVFKILGATSTAPFFNFCGQEIVSILDPPHLLKCTRNLLIKHDIEVTSDFQCNEKPVKGTVKWSHIEAFYQLDKTNPNLVYAPQLTDNHLHPNCQQKMRVKLAAQVFSHSVTTGMLMKIAQNELPAEAHVTATFVQKFDELFDAVNADSPDLRRGKKYSTNLNKKTPHLALFRNMREFISNMKYIGSKSNPPSQEGWIHTLNAIERLWKNLQAIGIKSLPTRRLNQDPLENCFGCIRYSCGSNNSPTINQFIAGIKTAIISNLKHSGHKKNCEDDTAIISNNLSNFLTPNISPIVKSPTLQFDDTKEMENLLFDAVEAVEQGTSESQACGYVCGFIFKKLRHSNCQDCRKAFLSDTQEIIHRFTNFKEYDPAQNSLNYVGKDMVTCVEMMANIINKYLKANAYRIEVKINIFSALECVDFSFLKKCIHHLVLNENHLKVSTFFIITKRYCVLRNRDMDDEEKKKTLERKMRILKNK
ncbi:unnamed protein product [Parnassius mnemosyne]|uniref:Transposable element P transposase n=2 Tax=Parnassius mnemosyne TaxID=213953 RepID=A0AAV1LTY6_9NEOP